VYSSVVEVLELEILFDRDATGVVTGLSVGRCVIWYLHGEILRGVPSPAGWDGSLCEIRWSREIHIVVIDLDRLMDQLSSIIDILSLVFG
jgi:hypothetical protein